MARSLKILFVDHDVDFTEATAEVLRGDGHDVCCARDAASALTMASDFSPDVVLLDVGLPGADGYDVARALRQLLPPAAPIIVITGLQSADHSDDIDLIMSKPVALDLFGGLVEYIRRCRQRDTTGDGTR